ncbi:MAG: acyl-CoA dehydrogenase family protein [Pseudomonadota bacterium]
MTTAFDTHMRKTLPFLDAMSDLADTVSPSITYDNTGEYAARVLRPLDDILDHETHAFPRDQWHQLSEQGLKGLIIPAEYGGMGLNYMHLALATLQISRASGSIGLSFLADQALCAHQIIHHGTPDQKAAYLPQLASGAFVGALAMSEPEAGSDVMAMRTMAVPTSKTGEPGFIINGSKMWITNGGRIDEAGQKVTADILVLYAATQQDPKKLTAFLVESGTSGFEAVSKIEKEGMRGSETWELSFNNCFVPATHVLGEVNRGGNILMQGLNAERLILGAGALGLGVAAMDDALEYASQRRQSGIPIAYNQTVAHKLADLFSELVGTTNHLLLTAATAEKHLSNASAASVFLAASRLASQITEQNVYLHGGNGQTTDYRAGRLKRDASLYRVGGGTEDVRSQRIAEDILPGYGAYLRQQKAFQRNPV